MPSEIDVKKKKTSGIKKIGAGGRNIEITEYVRFSHAGKIYRCFKGERYSVDEELKNVLVIRGVCRVL